MALGECFSQVLSILDSRGAIVQGLPAQCQLHGTKSMLDAPAAFSKHSPQGGCCAPCKQPLPCGHECSLRCHVFDRSHEKVPYRELIHSFCTQGHLVTRE